MANQADDADSGDDQVLCEYFDTREGKMKTIRCSRDECLNDHNGQVIGPP